MTCFGSNMTTNKNMTNNVMKRDLVQKKEPETEEEPESPSARCTIRSHSSLQASHSLSVK